ncbi:glycosyltransferase [Acidovorax sp. SDU_ACID1]|uniref:glycosyltransferase family protein n=1 Tax=Acidovorax sp. SDU_ACID1 TaxID=3136632 RepID=UPI0038736C99
MLPARPLRGGTNPSLLEALACGNWVFAHDNPYNREVARDAAAYFDTPEQLARSLDQWAASTDGQRPERSRRARQRIAENYTWEGITDAYEALIRSECGARAAHA